MAPARSLLPLAVAVLVATALAVALVPASGAASPGDLAATDVTQSTNATSGDDLAPGAHLAGAVASGDESVRGSVHREALAARLDDAGTDAERAAVLDGHLAASERRVAGLERRVDAVQSGTDGAPLDGGAPFGDSRATARTAAVGSGTAAEARLLADVEAAVGALPRDARAEHDLSARVDDLDDRLATLRERTGDATAAIDGEPDGDGSETDRRHGAVTTSDVDAAAGRALSGGGRVAELFGSERIDLHVRAADGTTRRYAVDTADGSVRSVDAGAHDDPTLRVYTTDAVVRAVRDADDPRAEVRAALDDDRLAYDGVGLRRSVKYGVVSLAESLGGLV